MSLTKSSNKIAPGEFRFSSARLRGRALDRPWLRELFRDDVFEGVWNARRLIKQDGADRAPQRCVVVVERNGEKLLLKCFRRSLWQRTLKPRALSNSYQRLRWLSDKGIAVPAGLASFEWMSAEGNVWECVAQVYLEGASTLHQHLTMTDLAAPLKQAELITKTMQALAALHQLQRYHGDMKLTNIMVQFENIFLVDVKGARSHRISRWQQKDLARFLVGLVEANVEKKQIAGAVKVYQQALNRVDPGFFDGVRVLTKRIARRHARRYGQPISDKLPL